MNTENPTGDEPESDQIDREELERDLRQWFETQDYSQEEVDQVLQKMRRFDARTLQESFFASLGTGSIEFNEMIDSILSDHSDKPAELEFVIERWPELSPATKKAIYALAKGNLPPASHQAIIALVESLPPAG
ncbi:MAG: hypothetical protein KDA84_02315 [Planctomycetaceae bacterium]|nr:hypothetical protein [Planctomycetaceae bacterium]